MKHLLLAAVLLSGALAPAAVEEIGPVRFEGTWKDPDNFSGAARVGDRLLVAIDEEGYLQTGMIDTAGPSWTVTRDPAHDVVLAEGALTTKIELDIEALAASGSTVFALGSHSATRERSDRADRPHARNRERLMRDTKANGERDIVARFTIDGASGAVTNLQKTSLRPAFAAAGFLKPFVDEGSDAAPAASKENGIDLEGLAIDGDGLLAGFRGPVLRHGFVPVLRFRFEAPAAGEWRFVPLDGRGIRDMAAVEGGVLLLAGPVGDGDAPHRLYLWNGKDCVPGAGGPGGTLRWLGDVPAPSAAPTGDREKAKAEAVLVTATTPSHFEVLVLYDSLPMGGATRFRVARAGAGDTAATRLCGATQ
jgi:hypothetical protein